MYIKTNDFLYIVKVNIDFIYLNTERMAENGGTSSQYKMAVHD